MREHFALQTRPPKGAPSTSSGSDRNKPRTVRLTYPPGDSLTRFLLPRDGNKSTVALLFLIILSVFYCCRGKVIWGPPPLPWGSRPP